MFDYADALPDAERPSLEVMAVALLEQSLGMLVDLSESTALAWELILPRLAAFNSEWANDDRAELRAIAEDERDDGEWEDDDEEEDDDPDDSGDDDGNWAVDCEDEEESDEAEHDPFGGIQWGTVVDAKPACARASAARDPHRAAYAYNQRQWNPFRSRPRPGIPGLN
jgi:hypothetical protein